MKSIFAMRAAAAVANMCAAAVQKITECTLHYYLFSNIKIQEYIFIFSRTQA